MPPWAYIVWGSPSPPTAVVTSNLTLPGATSSAASSNWLVFALVAAGLYVLFES